MDALVLDRDEIRGYDGYLIEAEAAGVQPEAMEGRLHSDRVRRRPFDPGSQG